jgi:hypothetical protein
MPPGTGVAFACVVLVVAAVRSLAAMSSFASATMYDLVDHLTSRFAATGGIAAATLLPLAG